LLEGAFEVFDDLLGENIEITLKLVP